MDIKRLIRNTHYRGLRLFIVEVTFFIILSLVMVISLKWMPPPTSSFMMQDSVEGWLRQTGDSHISYQWTDWKDISPYVKVAAMTSEDQRFPSHWGLDLMAIRKAINESQQGDELRGASTITQQVAKNLFLWSGQTYIRKGLEAYFALMIELFWSKKRILEVYLNIAQFGDSVYGVHAASREYFGTMPDKLTMRQSAMMITALPNPKQYDLANPSPYMIERRNWILRYMFHLGNTRYLDRLE